MRAHIGQPTSRYDGRAKVTGAAKYAGEFNTQGLAHGVIVTSRTAKGRVTRIDAGEALRVPGVLDVLTHQNRPNMAANDKAYQDDVAPDGSPYRPLYDDKVLFSDQPVAVVLAEEWEIAQHAATLVRVEYEEEPHATAIHAHRSEAYEYSRPAKPRGNAEKAYAAAEVQHEAEYFVPVEHHNPMELFASTVIWEGDGKLTVYDKTQGVQNVQRYLCAVFKMKPENVRVVSPYVGGAFGSGLRPGHQAALAVLAALALSRSVRIVMTRQQMFTLGYRPATIEQLRLGAKAGGTLDAVIHEAIAMTSRHEEFARNDTGWAGALYKSPAARYVHHLVKLDLPTPADMRAPGGATGVYGLECAMDELATRLNLDPLELRLRCYSDRDQNEGTPYSSKKLRECYAQGAEAFGWDKRSPEPRSMREDHELIGYGMATGIWEAMQEETAARVVLTANGHAEVSCATSDIGTGTYTIMAQLTADMLGLPIENVTVRLGHSTLPQSPVEGGSWMAASVAGAIGAAAEKVRTELLRLAKKMPDTPFGGAKSADVTLRDGKLTSKDNAAQALAVTDIMRHAKLDRVEQEAAAGSNDDGKHARYAHSAVFAEARVDEELGIVRVTRIVNAVAAGRILNPKTARSQVMGGVVFGLGMALHEETLTDHRFGRFMNANLGEYHVPVNADVQDIKVIFVEEHDDIINPLGIKGVGEIGVVGTAAAIANAIYHATGKRVRDLPITPSKLLV
jgi:xanthine dehydrogenase YagR molybdenum-binding subunit